MGGTEGLADMPPELIDLLQPKDINTTPWSCAPPFRLQPTEASDTTSSLSLLDMEPSSPNPSSSPVIPRAINADDDEKLTKEAGTGKENEKEEIEEEAKTVASVTPSEKHQEKAEEEGKEKEMEKKESKDMSIEKEKEEGVHEIASSVGESKVSATMELDTHTITSSAALPMIPINEEDADESLFPSGKYDEHNQQIDLRSTNSWIYQMDQVPLIELAEVHVINSLAPYLLNSMLMPLMRKSPEVLLLPCFFPPPPHGEYLLKAIHTVGSLYY